MSLKFVQIPTILMNDIEEGKLIPNDILVYSYLVRAINRAGGKFLLKKENEMAGENYNKRETELNEQDN